MNEFSNDKRAQANAILALAVTRESATFNPPSDEELAALLEAGLTADNVAGMDNTRKAQVVDAIANDATTFNRWVLLAESAETLELTSFGSEGSTQTTSADSNKGGVKSLLNRLFSNPFKGLATAGGGLAAASVLTLMVTTNVSEHSQVDQLYGDYAQQWTSMPSQQSVTRSVSSDVKLKLSAEDSALFAGVTAGLGKLDPAFSLPNLVDANVLSSTDSLDAELQEKLQLAGQIAALSYFKCSLGANPAFYTEALLLLEELQAAFANSNDVTSNEIDRALNRSGDAETKVCRVSKKLITRVSY